MKENLKKIKPVAIAISPLILSMMIISIISIFFIALKSEFSAYISLIEMFDAEGIEQNEGDPPDVFTEIQNPESIGEKVYSSDIEYPARGSLYGKIYIPKNEIETDLYFSDSDNCLNKGAGQSYSTRPIGFGAPYPLIGGHNNTAFNALQYLENGDEIKISTSYGNYIYRVYETKICLENQFSYNELKGEKDIVVLYTCYPFTALGLTKQRFFVYAEKISGPVVVEE